MLALAHHVLMYLVFRRIFQAAVPRSRWAYWYPVANGVVDLILIRSLWMCLTGKVTWRGTDYSTPATPSASVTAANSSTN